MENTDNHYKLSILSWRFINIIDLNIKKNWFGSYELTIVLRTDAVVVKSTDAHREVLGFK